MPRGVRTIKTDEQLIQELEESKISIQEKIDKLKSKLSDIDSQITEIQDAQKRKKVESLLSIVDASGMSPDEIKELIAKSKGKTVIVDNILDTKEA